MLFHIGGNKTLVSTQSRYRLVRLFFGLKATLKQSSNKAL